MNEEYKKVLDKLGDVNHWSIKNRRVKLSKTLHAPKWIIKGIIPEGIGVISGSGGVGKTTAIVPLALAVAGLQAPESDLEVEINRKVIYITEDSAQVQLIINGMSRKLGWGDREWNLLERNFILVDSLKITYQDLSLLLSETASEGLNDRNFVYPLTIFDTSSSNFMVKNENDNAEVSQYMETLRKHYRDHDSSLWLVNHLSKTSRGQTIDDMQNLSARGGGAWQDEAMWTAILSTSLPDGKGDRILKMIKRRVILQSDEISFKSSQEKIQAIDRFGKSIHIPYFYCIPRISSEGKRKSLKHHDLINELKEKIVDVLVRFGDSYPSRNDVFKEIKGNRNYYVEAIDSLLSDGVISEYKLPEELKARGRNSGLRLTNGGAF